MRLGGATEADENADPTRLLPARNPSPLRKKVLGERNGGCGGMEALTPPPQPKPVPSPPTLTGRGAGAYDPKTNYTTPRQEFRRYDPERHREMLLRLARSAEVVDEDDSSSAASGTAASEAAGSDSEDKLDDGDDVEKEEEQQQEEEVEEEEIIPAGRGRWVRRLFLLLFALACSCCYIYCMNPTPFPPNHNLSLSGLGPLYMMDPEDVLDETASPIVQGSNESVARQYDRRAASRNSMAIAMMGLADMCPNVQLGASACIIGDVNIENVDDLKEKSELSEQNAAVMVESFENDARNISWHSVGPNSTQTIDMEGDSSGLINHEEEEDYSNQFVSKLVSVEKAIGSSSDKLDSELRLEREGLDLDTELWQYEQTAEAAKKVCSKVKYLWSAMEPHFLRILACLSVAGLVATMFKYYPRSREITVPASQQMSSKSLKQVPVLVPHQIEQLSVSPSLQVPKQNLSCSLEIPMQLPLPKSGPLALRKTDPVQKLQNGDAELKASHDNSEYHRDNDSSKPPVVELLGEFTFGNGSRRKSVNPVQESLESLVGDVDKWPKNSSILQSPSVRRARKEDHASKGENDMTMTPLRRSSRLLNKVTSP